MARRCRPLAHLVTIRVGIIMAMHRIVFFFCGLLNALTGLPDILYVLQR